MNISTSTIGFARKLHYLDPEHNATADNVAQTLENCLSGYYETLTNQKFEKSPDYSTLYSYESGSYPRRGYGNDLIDGICARIPTSINPDVGGVGVYVSYWIQTGLAILGFVGTLFWKWAVPNVSVGFLTLRHGRTRARTRSEPIQRLSQKHLSRLIAALTDFHKAQCFYMLATNVAALVVIGRGGLDPQSLQQIYNTWIFLKVIALNGFLPITFTLANLYIVGMSSWYMTLTSCLTVIFSGATFATVGKFNPGASDMASLKTVAETGGPQECDYRKPGVYCYTPIGSSYSYDYFYSDYYSWNLDNDANYILAFCLTIMCLLLGHMLRIQNLALVRSIRSKGPERSLMLIRSLWRSVQKLCHHDRTIDLCSKARQVLLKISKYIAPVMALSIEIPALARYEHRLLFEMTKVRASRPWQLFAELFASSFTYSRQRFQALGWRRALRILLQAGLYIFVLSMYIQFFIMFLRYLAWFSQNNVYNKTWNFGQVVAITVWAPPIIEYIHLEIRGLQRGFDHRLMRPYRVTRTSGMAHAMAAGTVDICKQKFSPEDLERGEERPPTSNPDQNNRSVPVWKDAHELTSLSENDDDDASETSHKSHSSPLEGPAAIIPLNEEGAGNDDEHMLLPEPKLGSRASSFPRIPYERNVSR